MGRNGKQAPVFPEMVKFVNNNVGKVVSSKEILLGKEPGRNSETAYLYNGYRLFVHLLLSYQYTLRL